MKLKVLQENFSKIVSTATRFTSSKAQLPVLANIYIACKGNKLSVSSTNLEVSYNSSVGAKVEKEGEITVPARIINDIVSNLNPGPIDLTTDKERLNISTDNFNSNVSGMNPSDFPEVPKKLGKNSYTIETKLFKDALSKTLFSVSVDETRPILTGILFIFNKKGLSLVSTDGFRLSKKDIKIKEIKENEKVILPKTILSEILRITSDQEEIQFSFNKSENQVIFKVDNTILSRVLQGEFPDFEKIIPKTSELEVGVGKDDLLQAVKLASVFAQDSANIVKLLVNKNKLTIEAESQSAGSQENEIDAKVEGEFNEKKGFQIAYNYRFLEEFLNSIEGDDVKLKFTNSSAPGVLLDEKDKDYLHLIMPVKLQD